MPFRFRMLALVVILTAATTNADESTTAEPSPNTDVWVTSIASAMIESEGAPKAMHFAGTASGLLLQVADVVRWEGDDFANRVPIMTHPAAVWCVQVSDDGKHVASTDYRGNLQLFDVATGKVTMHEAAFERWTQAMRFAPNSKAIIAGNEAGKLIVWEDGKVSKSIDVDKNAITDIAFDGDGDQLALSDGAGTVHLYSWPGLEPAGKIKVSDSPAWCVRYTADSSAVLVGTGDRALYRSEAKDGSKPEMLLQGSDWITRLAISSTGAIAATEVSGKVFVLNSDKVGETKIEPSGTAPSGVWAVHWSSPSNLLVGTRKNGIMALTQSWSFATSPAADKSSAHE
jgi:WD40 repeat protein